VVDNGSTDETAVEVPKRFTDAIRYIRQANMGPGGGYNTGLREAAGQFIQFLDGDDFLSPGKIAKQLEVFRQRPEVDIVYGDVRYFQSEPRVERNWKDVDLEDYPDFLAALVKPDHKDLNIGALLHRRRALDKTGEWDETLEVVDYDYWLRAAWKGCRFQYCPNCLTFCRIHPTQVTANKQTYLRGFETVWMKALGYITEEPYRSQVQSSLARTRLRMAIELEDLSAWGALQKLAQARRTKPQSIPLPAYTLAGGAVLVPGARRLLRQQWMEPLRHRVAQIALAKRRTSET